MTWRTKIMAELQAVDGIIAHAQAGLAADSPVDLAPLESRIEEICSRIEGLPAAESHILQPKLLALIDDFGRLGQSIERKLAELKGQMGDAAGRRAAVNAYSKSSEPGR